MIWQTTPYTIPLIAASAASIILGLHILFRYPWAGNKIGAFAIFANAEWILGYALELASGTLPIMIFWDKVQFGAIIVLPTAWFVYIVYYTGHENWLTRRTVTALIIVPVITLLLALTNNVHKLIWTSHTLKEGPFLLLDETYGLWFWIYVVYIGALLLSGVILLISLFIRSRYPYRWQASTLLVGSLVPVSAAVLVLSGLNPIPYLNLIPVALVITNVTVAFSIIYFWLGDIVPLAREAVVENMRDSVIILDTENRVVDVNSSAHHLIGTSKVIGTPISVWPVWSHIESLAHKDNGDTEIVVRQKESIYDVEISSLGDRHGRAIGRVVVLRDITERKRVEKAEKYRLLAENVKDVIWTMDMNLQFTYMSPSVIHLRGYTAEEVMNQSLDEILTPSSLAVALKTFEEELQKDREQPNLSRSVTLELEHMCKDGSTAWAEVRITGLRDAKDNIVGILGVSRDITERKKAEEEIIKFKTLFDRAAYGSTISDFDGNFIYANEAFAQMHGYTPKELTGKNAALLHTKEQMKKIKELQEQLKTEGMYTAEEVWHKRKDNTVFPTLMSGTLIKDEKGTPLFMGITAVDITERKKTEEMLQQSEEKYRTLIENLNVGVYRTTPGAEGKFIDVNQAFAEMLGYTKEEILKLKVSHIYVDPQDRMRFSEKIITQGFSKNEELYLKKKDRTPIIISDTATPVYDRDGTLLYFDGISEDITQRKKAEEQIKASLREKEVLLREIHHRVKNNMQVISSLLSLQSRYIGDAHLAEAFKESQDRIKSMALVHEKLYQSGDLASIDFHEYIKSLMRNLFQSYETAGRVDLTVQVENVSLSVDAAIPCGLIINELVSNSLKHAFPEPRRGKISISLRQSGEDQIELVVADDGVGVPEDITLKNITSLGLHLVTILAEDQLEGTISLERSGGTEFCITFGKDI